MTAPSIDHLHWLDRRLGVDEWLHGAAPGHDRAHDHDHRSDQATPSVTLDFLEPGMAPIPRRLLPDSALVGPDGRLSVGEVDLTDLARSLGSPVFVYDEEHLRSRCREARLAFGEGVAYAGKAFLCQAMARLAAEEGLGIDVASGGEMAVALAAGVDPGRLVLHGSNKSDAELAQAVDAGVGRIVVDSFGEIDRLERLLARGPGRPWPQIAANAWTGPRPQVLIRVNPGVGVATHPSVATGQEDSKFGFSLASGAAADAADRLSRADSPVELVGLHTHLGSQVVDFDGLRRAVANLAPLLADIRGSELCVGGGLGVATSAGDDPTPTLTEWAAEVHRACTAAEVPARVRVTAEPGRSVVATAGLTCYTIGTIKTVPLTATGHQRCYVSVDGGMSDNPRPALYGSRYEAFLPREAEAPRFHSVTIVGKHCESGDVLVRHGHVPDDAAVGDVLAVPVTGAYCYAMASNYNRLPRPPVVFVRDGRARLVVRRETYQDLLRLDV